MVCTARETVALCIFPVLCKAFVAVAAAFGRLNVYKTYRRLTLCAALQPLPIDVSLVVRDVNAVYRVAFGDAGAENLVSAAGGETVECRLYEWLVGQCQHAGGD